MIFPATHIEERRGGGDETALFSLVDGGRLLHEAAGSYAEPHCGPSTRFICFCILVLLDIFSYMSPLLVAQVLPPAVCKLDMRTKVLPVGGAHCCAPSNTCPLKERMSSVWAVGVSCIDSTWLN